MTRKEARRAASAWEYAQRREEEEHFDYRKKMYREWQQRWKQRAAEGEE